MKVVSIVLILVVHLQTVQFCVGQTTRCNQYSGLGFRNGNCELCTRTSRCAYYQDGEIGYCIPLAQVVNMGRISAHSFPYPKDYSRVYRKAVEFIRSSSLPIYWHKGQCNQAGLDLGFEVRAYDADYNNGANPASSEEVEDECKDEYFNCRYWALVGECTENAANMHRICKKSCGICKPEICEDKDPYCSDWASTGECKNNPSWMGVNCALACKLCTPEICEDKNDHCSEWASLGECSGANRAYMVTSCALSCNVCPPKVTQTTTSATTMVPPGVQCHTCGTETKCDYYLNGTSIYCEDPEDTCIYYFSFHRVHGVTIKMGCNDGRYSRPNTTSGCDWIDDFEDSEIDLMQYCVCESQNCNLMKVCMNLPTAVHEDVCDKNRLLSIAL